METPYNTHICLLIQIIQHFFFIQYASSLQLTCPVISQWNIRAKGFCNNAKPSYYCLFDKNLLYYKEFCRQKEDFHQPGNKYIVRGDIDGTPCENNRYQPFKFRTDRNSKCVFKKSTCSEEGQVIHNNGTTTSDITCRCDITRGYGFVITPTHKCFCYPTEEDCSCYRRKCNTNQLPNPNHECEPHLISDFDCNKIKTRWTEKITLTAQTKPTVIQSSFPELTSYKAMIHQAIRIILIIFFSMAFLSAIFIRYVNWYLQKCNKCIMMEDIISRRVEEGISQYKEQLHNDIFYHQISDWKKDDVKFIATKTTNEIYDQLQKDRCVLVVGRAGCQKSSILHHIALKMQNEKQYDIIPIFTAGSIFELVNHRRNQIFIVDNFCGKMNINAQSVDGWYSHMDEILTLIHTNGKSKRKNMTALKFLFATRLDVYDEILFQKLTGFTKYVYRLSDRSLGDDEKLPIIKTSSLKVEAM